VKIVSQSRNGRRGKIEGICGSLRIWRLRERVKSRDGAKRATESLGVREGASEITENQISKIILDCSFVIHKYFGPGLLESVYEELLSHEIRKRGLSCERQVAVPIVYENIKLEIGFRADLVIDGKVIVELKSVETVLPVHKKQLLTYLKVTGMKLGLLINFNEALLKNGITRIVNNL
jgi:GxxExxY protein